MISFAENIKNILEAIEILNPKSILDVGCGFGKYGILVREALLSNRAEAGDVTPQDDLRIDCVEIAQYFINTPYLRCIYKGQYWQDAKTIPARVLGEYDLILLIDVLEHWKREEGKKFIEDIKKENPKTKILVSTPKSVTMYREDYYGKDCPKHVSQWERSDFVGYDGALEVWSDKSHIFII